MQGAMGYDGTIANQARRKGHIMFGNGPSIINRSCEGGLTTPVAEATTPQLVRAYTEIRVRVAVHTVMSPDVAGWFGPLGPVVDELRRRGALD